MLKKVISLIILMQFICMQSAYAEPKILKGILVKAESSPIQRGILVQNLPLEQPRIIMGQIKETHRPKRGILIATPYSNYHGQSHSYHNDWGETVLGLALIGGIVALIANADYTSVSYHGGYSGHYGHHGFAHHGFGYHGGYGWGH